MIEARSERPILTPSPRFRIGRLAICIAATAILFLAPPPEGLSLSGWHIFVVFLGTITGFILRPLPMAPLVLLALAALILADSVTETAHLSLNQAFLGFANSTTWLVVFAILISGSVVRTQLGTRIALTCFSYLGRSTLGLGYAICVVELILAPFIPSNTARGGGIIAPIVRSMNKALGQSLATKTRSIDRYLISCGAHANLITSAMFLTAMAANPLVAAAAQDVYGVDFHWSRWFLGAVVPGSAGLLLLPLVLKLIFPHHQHGAVAAQQQAKRNLEGLGPISRDEILLLTIFVAMISLWVSGPWHGISTTTVCLCGVIAILLLRIDRWEQMIAHAEAWDTLIWLGGLLTLANALKQQGVIDYFTQLVSREMTQMHPILIAILVATIYFYSMYGFSMLTGHIIALAGAFFIIGQQAETPAMLIIPLIAYFSSLCGCLTNYSTGPVIIYLNQGSIPPAIWFRTGFLISLFHLTIWLGLGIPYWRALGWW